MTFNGDPTKRQYFQGRQHKTIIQFIHGWLPVNASHSKTSAGTARLCPYCSSCDESQQHWLQCTHNELTILWKSAADTLARKLRKYNKNMDAKLVRLLGLAITDWRTTTSPSRPDFVTPNLYSLFDKQSLIGWNQILQGRFSKAWNISPSHDSISSTAYVVRIIWQHLHEVWLSRCGKAHGTDSTSQRKMALLRLKPQVEKIFQERHNLEPTEQYIFKHTLEETLALPTATICSWIFQANNRISRAKKRQRQLVKHHLPTHPFFSRLPSHKRHIKQNNKLGTTTKQSKKSTDKRPHHTITTLTKFFPILRQRPRPVSKDDLFPP
jgi:hypothetical protein